MLCLQGWGCWCQASRGAGVDEAEDGRVESAVNIDKLVGMQAKPHGQKYELQDMSFMNVGFGKLAWDCVRRTVYDKQAAVAFIHSNMLAPKRLYSNFCPIGQFRSPVMPWTSQGRMLYCCSSKVF